MERDGKGFWEQESIAHFLHTTLLPILPVPPPTLNVTVRLPKKHCTPLSVCFHSLPLSVILIQLQLNMFLMSECLCICLLWSFLSLPTEQLEYLDAYLLLISKLKNGGISFAVDNSSWLFFFLKTGERFFPPLRHVSPLRYSVKSGTFIAWEICVKVWGLEQIETKHGWWNSGVLNLSVHSHTPGKTIYLMWLIFFTCMHKYIYLPYKDMFHCIQ